MNFNEFFWLREPKSFKLDNGMLEVVTNPNTDLWQRTYYRFCNDNAPMFLIETEEKFFSFTVKTNFSDSKVRFDQCGIVVYLDAENWLKSSVEYENEKFQHLGSVVTNGGYSDWATTEISPEIKTMWYRLSRRNDDFCIECSSDGKEFAQMRICHLQKALGKIKFGVYACSPENSSFKAKFRHFSFTDCMWKAHDGQKPDKQ